MNRLRRIIYVSCIVSIWAWQLSAQLTAPLNSSGEPFNLKAGSSFTASGGTAKSAAVSEIAGDIREADEVIKQNYGGGAVTNTDLTKNALDGMLRVLDPHSNFFDAVEWKDMLDEEDSTYTGIGATISNFERGGMTDTYILSTFPNSPAAKAQLRFGDRIVAINGENISQKGSDIVRDKLRGEPGTPLKLTVERAATNHIETIEIKRNHVFQPSIPDAYILRPGVGYIDLSEGFNYTTADEFDAAMQKLAKLGMKSLVLDLRGNGGGIVDQAVKVAQRFLPAGTLILTQRGRTRIDNRVWRSTNPTPETMPLVVLVNEDTASASEIVAGAFQDEDRALIVGERTFGKGLVQSVIDLPGRTGLTLTTARYLTPSGRSIQRDYTKLNIYDYYDHKSPAAEIDSPYFEARTVTDRKVLGGDGIQPDETVKADRLDETRAALLDPIFFFVREVVNGRSATSNNFRPAAFSNGKRWTPADTDALMIQFDDFAKATGKFSTGVLARESAFIKLRLNYNFAMAEYGSVAAERVVVEDDPQVAKALEILPKAAQLTQSATIARRKIDQ